ncbi:regulatory protein GemA [Filifactor villosus]|uniref:Regulatory protein GemA n=1 Tax=Filifactor villosus TaxID=29374 RepID=A0ABV9QSX1_9FIRM
MKANQYKNKEINRAQINKIWASAAERGMSKEDLYALIFSVAKKESMKALTWIEANAVINRIVGAEESEIYQNKVGRQSTERMRRKIHMLVKTLGWDNNPARIQGFCKKMFGVEKVEWLSAKQCYQLIEALKKIIAREEAENEDHQAPGAEV